MLSFFRSCAFYIAIILSALKDLDYLRSSRRKVLTGCRSGQTPGLRHLLVAPIPFPYTRSVMDGPPVFFAPRVTSMYGGCVCNCLSAYSCTSTPHIKSAKMSTRARKAKVSLLDDKIHILDRGAAEYSPAKEVFKTVAAILALVRVGIPSPWGICGLLSYLIDPTRTRQLPTKNLSNFLITVLTHARR